jgi:hypothetical protein
MHSVGGENLDQRKSLEELALDGIIQLGGSSRNGSVWIEFDWFRTETRGTLS